MGCNLTDLLAPFSLAEFFHFVLAFYEIQHFQLYIEAPEAYLFFFATLKKLAWLARFQGCRPFLQLLSAHLDCF